MTRSGIVYRLGPVAGIPVGEGRAFTVPGLPPAPANGSTNGSTNGSAAANPVDASTGGSAQVAVFRLRDGGLRATQARCPHAGGPLADGQLDAAKVVCPLHARAFSFAEGRCPEGEQVRIYRAYAENGEIIVEL
ncbi:MAG TPA: Rieske 2Fe-2S domain-containing protein [Pseudonocardia sp.]